MSQAIGNTLFLLYLKGRHIAVQYICYLGGEIYIDFIKLGNYLPQGRQENQEETEKEMKSRGEAEKEEPNPEKHEHLRKVDDAKNVDNVDDVDDVDNIDNVECVADV